MPITVFVNGIDDADGPNDSRREKQRKLLGDQFYDTDVEIFDSFTDADREISEGYLRLKAKLVIARLCELAKDNDLGNKETIVFAAHNIGAALVKQVLLISLEDRRVNWIALQTVALHLIEAPSYTDDRKWEEFLFRLLSAGRLPLSNLAAIIHALPGELSRTEVQFSAISQAYEIHLRNRHADAVYDRSEDLWYFGDDGSRMVTVFDGIRASMRKTNARLDHELYRGLMASLTVPEAATGRLNPSPADMYSMSWLEEHEAYKTWLDAPGSSLLAVSGPRGSGKTHVASHVLYSLRTRALEQHTSVDKNAIFLSFGFYRWDNTRNTEWALVSSLIRQFLLLRPDAYSLLRGAAAYLYEIRKASSEQLWRLFRYMLSIPCVSKVYIVVNAADQCHSDVKSALASLVTRPAVPKHLPTKVFVTISGDDGLPNDSAIKRLTLEALQFKDIIRKVAVARVERLVNRRPVWRGREDEIVERMTFDGSYLHCMLSLELLEHDSFPSTRAALQEHLMVPPPSLYQIFGLLVSRVKRSHQATMALQWVYHAVRPLTVSELSVALAISSLMIVDKSEAGTPSKQLTEKEGELSVANTLVNTTFAFREPAFNDLIETVSWDLVRDLAGEMGPTVKIFNEQVTLVHHTFRTYLETNTSAIIGPAFHAAIAEMCLWYITEASKDDQNDEWYQSNRLARLPAGFAADLLDYAELYWAEHLKLAGDAAVHLNDKVIHFLAVAGSSRSTARIRRQYASPTPEASRSQNRAQSISRSPTRNVERYRSPRGREEGEPESPVIPKIRLSDADAEAETKGVSEAAQPVVAIPETSGNSKPFEIIDKNVITAESEVTDTTEATETTVTAESDTSTLKANGPSEERGHAGDTKGNGTPGLAEPKELLEPVEPERTAELEAGMPADTTKPVAPAKSSVPKEKAETKERTETGEEPETNKPVQPGSYELKGTNESEITVETDEPDKELDGEELVVVDKPVEPQVSVEPQVLETESAKPEEKAESAENEEAFEPAAAEEETASLHEVPAEPAESVEPEKPTKPADSTGKSDSIKPAEATEANEDNKGADAPADAAPAHQTLTETASPVAEHNFVDDPSSSNPPEPADTTTAGDTPDATKPKTEKAAEREPVETAEAVIRTPEVADPVESADAIESTNFEDATDANEATEATEAADALLDPEAGELNDKDEDAPNSERYASSVVESVAFRAPAYSISTLGDPLFNRERPDEHWLSYSVQMYHWPDESDESPLCIALQLGLDHVVKSSLEKLDFTSPEYFAEHIERLFITSGNSGNLNIIEKLLEVRPFDVDSRVKLKAFCFAARQGHLHICKRLLQSLELDDADEVSWLKEGKPLINNPLHAAVEGGQLQTVEMLLENGVSILSRDLTGSTAIHAAAKMGDVAVLEIFLVAQADAFKQGMSFFNNEDLNPLQIACGVGYYEPFCLLLEHAPKELINTRGKRSYSPLQICAELGHLAIWEKLVDAGADPLAGEPQGIVDVWSYDESIGLRQWMNNNPTQIELASRYGHYEIMSKILKRMSAARKKELEEEKAKQKDAEQNKLKDKPEEKPKDEDAAGRSNNNSSSSKEAGDEDENGETEEPAQPEMDRHTKTLASSLFEAASNGHVRLVKALLDKTERDPPTDHKHLRLAIGRGHLDVIKALVAVGISLRKPDSDYDSHFDLAISENFVDIVRYLIATGDLRSQWDGDETSIQYAARAGRILSLRLMLNSSGMEPSELRRKNDRDFTAMDLAAEACELATFQELMNWEKAHDIESPKTVRALVLAIEGVESAERKVKFVEFLLANKWDPNVSDGSENIPLHAAIRQRHHEIVQMLLNLGANPNTTDDNGNNALHIVAMIDFDYVVNMLLEKSADPDAVNNDGLTPLHVAADKDHDDTFRLLLGLPLSRRHRVQDPDDDDNDMEASRRVAHSHANIVGPLKRTIVHYATHSDMVLRSIFDAIESLDLQININAADENGKTPLMMAAHEGPIDVVELLLEKGADVHLRNELYETAIYFAARRELGVLGTMSDVFRALAKHGADVNALGGVNGTLLYTVLRDGYPIDPSSYSTLLELGATADIHKPPFYSPLHVMLHSSAALEDAFPVVAPDLVKAGAKVDALDSRDRTALMYMVSHGSSLGNIAAILELGADPNIRDAAGMTPLHNAVWNLKSPDVVTELLKHGANDKALDATGRSVLYMASLVDPAAGRSVFDMLVERLPEDQRLAQKSIAFTAALKNGYMQLYESIMREPGLDVNVPDRNGWTALDVTTAHRWEDTSEELVKLGAVRGTDKLPPTQLSVHDINTSFYVSEDGIEAGILDLRYRPYYNEYINGTVRADHCISQDTGIFYFEVEVIDIPNGCAVAIGLTLERVALDDLAGWANGTWGYHSDDGTILSGESELDRGESYGPGDVIGMAYDLETRKLWYTKNGELAAVSWQPMINKRARDEKEANEGKTKDDKDDKDDKNDDGEPKQDGNDDDNASVHSIPDDREDNAIIASLLKGQLYPCISFQLAYENGMKVRANFGPDGAAQTPFKYAPPTAVPDDPPAKLERLREGDDGDDNSDAGDNNGGDKEQVETNGVNGNEDDKEETSDANDKDSDEEST
ncbi:hypothetical protein SBRCBS47491_007090 [Sporothrix bragantina]|uniref:B30.2/SPRY domain-containing protein n=1 Tax=Sporothrix bragantina TaxID=671064 RepID=A0ABP0CCJ0_9PEZI